MSNTRMATQAALIYADQPTLNLDEIRVRINKALSKRGYPEFEMGMGSSEQFALFRSSKMHATVALHNGPLGIRGQERAAVNAVTRAKDTDFASIAQNSSAHVLICVGDGPDPVSFDQPAPVDVKIKLEVLLTLIRLVMRQARPKVAHLCTSDMFYTADELEAGFANGFAPSMMLHPIETKPQPGPDGELRKSLILFQSEYLAGKTIVLEGIPDPVPLDMSLSLAETMIRQHMKGTLPLADGDALKEAVGMELYIRHAEPNAAFPSGRIIASFWATPAETADATAATPFINHPGYAAISASPSSRDDAEDATDDTWSPSSTRSAYVSDKASGKRSSSWMLLVGIGLFLWIGLPMLNIPKAVLEATFSEGLGDTEAQPGLPQNR